MTYEQILKEYLLITEKKYADNSSTDVEQITYEDDDFDKWDKDSQISGKV